MVNVPVFILYSFYVHVLFNCVSSQTAQIAEWRLDSCSLFYDINNASARSTRDLSGLDSKNELVSNPESEWNQCDNAWNFQIFNQWETNNGSCDCSNGGDFFDITLKNSEPDRSAGWGSNFRLGTQSILDYTIQLYTATYQIDALRQFFINGSLDEPLPESTFIELEDSKGSWTNISWEYTPTPYRDTEYIEITNTDTIEGIAMQSIHLHMEWDCTAQSDDDFVHVSYIELYGINITEHPTKSPTVSPTKEPTTTPTFEPTSNPSISPTRYPSTSPTQHPTTKQPTSSPTLSPTFEGAFGMTQRGEESTEMWSDNIYPLSDRGYYSSSNYTLPDKYNSDGEVSRYGEDRAFCVTCILGWSEIDARIQLQGCDDYNASITDPLDPESIWNCDDGTWILETSGRLADWQDTYSRLEIWEIDDNGLKWLQWYFQFQWRSGDTNYCYFNNTESGEEEDCNLLPLTSTSQYAAYFNWTMPKRRGDTRSAPLIVVWYDLLNVPYSLRPTLNYQFTNFTFDEIPDAERVTLISLWEIEIFRDIFIAIGILILFVMVMFILAAFFAPVSRASRTEFMIDTRNLRSTFMHSPNTIICPPEHIVNRRTFNCSHHGPWLVIVLTARLIYIFLFSFIFFILMFQNINNENFNVLAQYPDFGDTRTDQMIDYFNTVETAYSNETRRMATEFEYRDYWCYEYYVNQTRERFNKGKQRQIEYHNEQMDNPFGDYSFNWTLSDELYSVGDGQSACSTDTGDGAIVWVSKSQSIYYQVSDASECPVTLSPTVNPTAIPTTAPATEPTSAPTESPTMSGSDQSTTMDGDGDSDGDGYIQCKLDATKYNTSSTNFGEFETIITSYCNEQDWCVGWSFWDIVVNDTTNTITSLQSYALFSAMANTVTDPSSRGACFARSDSDSDLDFLNLDSSYFQNYSTILEAQYLEEFQSYADDLFETLQGLWSAIQDFNVDELSSTQYASDDSTTIDGDWIYNINQSSSAGYNFDIDLSDWVFNFVYNSDSGGYGELDYDAVVSVGCPDCPSGNFTQEFLQMVEDFVVNSSNLSDYTVNDVPVNVSSLVTFGSSLIAFPEFPEFNVPFAIDVPIDWTKIRTEALTLDAFLWSYRLFMTIGIVARIIRGRDVNVSLHSLMVDTTYTERPCCSGQTVLDTILNMIMWCYDRVQRISYTLWMTLYWLLLICRLAIIIIVLYFVYDLLDSTLTQNFFENTLICEMMTSPLRAQRAVRNQVLGTEALTYNNYSLTQIGEQIASFAAALNEDAYSQNEDELERVDEYNAVFCSGWSAYQQTIRDVTTQSTEGKWIDYNLSDDKVAVKSIGTYFTYDVNVSASIQNLFDSDSSTFWSPLLSDSGSSLSGDVTLDFYLTSIWMTATSNSSWKMDQITFDWRYNNSDSTTTTINGVQFEVRIEDATSGDWTSLGTDSFVPHSSGGEAESAITSSLQYVTVSEEEQEASTFHLKLVLFDVENWGDAIFLNQLSFAGSAADIDCPKVQFAFWDFEASLTSNGNASSREIVDESGRVETFDDGDGTFISECPAITPIHGLMYRGFVGEWLTENLEDGHAPFVDALRKICLSPFVIIMVLLGVLLIGYLMAFVLEWVLIKLDLYRENPYARVPLVVSDWDKYDADAHETGDRDTVYGAATAGMDYVGNETRASAASSGRDRDGLGLNLSVSRRFSNIVAGLRGNKEEVEMEEVASAANAKLAGADSNRSRHSHISQPSPSFSVDLLEDSGPRRETLAVY